MNKVTKEILMVLGEKDDIVITIEGIRVKLVENFKYLEVNYGSINYKEN